jgi:chemotaxis protein CheD
MFHPQTGIAAICHAMMPDGGSPDSFKYVDSVIHRMVLYFRQRKIPREEIQVKLFGGADMFNCIESNNSTVSRRNIGVAKRCLREYRLIPAVSDVGGKEGRKLIFRTDSGAVFLKKLNSQDLVCCVGGIEER